MDYFTVRPDFAVLDAYYPLNVHKEVLKTLTTAHKRSVYFNKLTKFFATDGITLGIESYTQGGKEWFVQANIDVLTSQFQDLTGRYEILEHFDNLLYMIVAEIQAIDSYYNYLQYESYDYQQRMKELAGLIYALKDRPQEKLYELKLTSTDKTTKKQINNLKLTDQQLIKWLTQFVINEVDNGRSPVGLFGIHENAVNRLPTSGPSTLRELRDAASTPNISHEQSINKQTTGRFCLMLIEYLNRETHLKIAEGKNSNNKQLQLLFDICTMFNVLHKDFDPDDKSFTPVKYMRVLLEDTKKAQDRRLDEKQSKSS